MQIRRAERADLAAIEALAAQMFQSNAVLHGLPAGATARCLGASLKPHSTVQVWLLEEEGRAVGYGISAHTWQHERGAVLYLDELYLTPECRGKGYGKAYLARMEQHAAEHGLDALALYVSPENTDAARLYERLGYEYIGYKIMIKERDKD